MCTCVLTVNNPIPSNIKLEAKKAAKILREFTEISSRIGPDKLIPGVCGCMCSFSPSLSVCLSRCLFWCACVYVCVRVCVRVGESDLVVILMHCRAVDSFSKGGNLTLGGNCTVSVGPMGRENVNVEADVALRSTTVVFTYSKSRGLFAGVSLEGPCLKEHKYTNRKYVTHRVAILNGDAEFPPEAPGLYCVLETYTDQYTTEWTAKHLAFCSPRHTVHQDDSLCTAVIMCLSLFLGVGVWYAGPVVVTAIYPFTGRQPGDLSFNPSDRITMVTKTELQYDWWEGTLNERSGIFPANFVSYP
uniref:SH3 domain-containing YSC84-like protein 1 n=1 Tax=Hucho hucho TaxID=62062 RepID=A0A4W5MXA2_9TELE